MIYNSLLFPVSVGFFLVLSIASYVNNIRLVDPSGSLFDDLNSISVLLSFLVISVIFVAELFFAKDIVFLQE